jgi:hypothetical protein
MEMKKIFLAVLTICLVSSMAFAQGLYVKSTETLVITSTTGVSTLASIPSEVEKAYIGISGNSVFWRAGGMSGVGTSGRGIVLDPTVVQPLVIDQRDMLKSMQFGTCSLTGTTIYVIYLGKP